MEGSAAEQVVAFTVQSGAGREADAIVETLQNLAPFVHGMLVSRHRKALESIVDALVPKIVPEPHELQEAAGSCRKLQC